MAIERAVGLYRFTYSSNRQVAKEGPGARVHPTAANAKVSCLSRKSVFVDPVCVHLARRIGAGPSHCELIRLLECDEEAAPQVSLRGCQPDAATVQAHPPWSRPTSPNTYGNRCGIMAKTLLNEGVMPRRRGRMPSRC